MRDSASSRENRRYTGTLNGTVRGPGCSPATWLGSLMRTRRNPGETGIATQALAAIDQELIQVVVGGEEACAGEAEVAEDVLETSSST